MKFLIESQSPDGIKITIKEPVMVDTWQALYDFLYFEQELELAADKITDDDRRSLVGLFDLIIRGKR